MNIVTLTTILAMAGATAFQAGAAEPTSPAAAPAAPPGEQVAAPTALDMLFERKHLGNVTAGQKLSYRFQRAVSKPGVLGQPFADDVTVDIRKVATDGTREVDVRVFTGERARDPQVIDGLTGNPILVVFLDRSVASYMALAGGKLPYLKDRFRSALRDRAKIEPVKVKVGGNLVDATKVTITPYSGDPNAQRMQGYENSRFSVVVSEAVPGHFIELLANYENSNADVPMLEERIVMAGAEVVKTEVAK